MNIFRSFFVVLCLSSLLSTSAFSTEVSWETLKTLEVDAKSKKQNISAELKKHLGVAVTIKGFMMPLEYDSKEISEFLFMPYVPSCMHVPPPPANQLVLVKMKKGVKIKPTFYPIELAGKLNVDINPDLESSFKMEGSSIKELKDFKAPTPAGAHQ